MKKKKVEKPKHKIENFNFILVLIAFVVIAVVVLSTYILQTKELGITTTTTTTTLTTSPITTIPTGQVCSNFSWNIISIEDFDLIGDFRVLVINFVAEYIGFQQENYGWAGSYRFRILDSGGKYYATQETDRYCNYSDKFQIGTVNTGDKTSGCLEFKILDANEPVKLVFYDNIIDTMCEINLQ